MPAWHHRNGVPRLHKLRSPLLYVQSYQSSLFKPGVGQNKAFNSLLNAQEFYLLICTFAVYSTAFSPNFFKYKVWERRRREEYMQSGM